MQFYVMIIYCMLILLVFFLNFIDFYQTLSGSVASALKSLQSLRLEGLFSNELVASLASENRIEF